MSSQPLFPSRSARLLARCIASAGAFLAVLPPIFSEEPPVLMPGVAAGKTTWENIEQLKGAAERGDRAAQAQFGELLLRGTGVEQDIPRALAMLTHAARAGEASAAFRIGMLFDDGDAVARGRARALPYFRAAAVGGVAEAFHNVGAAYVGAHGIKRDYVEGLAWLILARKRGVGADSEMAVRARIKKLRHPEWIAAGENRAVQLEAELGRSCVAAELAAAPDPVYLPSAAKPKSPQSAR